MPALARTIRLMGNQLVIWFAHGHKETGYATPVPGIYTVRGGAGGGPVDPPDPGDGTFVQPFDPDIYDANDPFGGSPGAIRNHFGSDYPTPINTPIRSIGTGVLVNKGESGGNGYYATFYFGPHNGREIYAGYIHLNEIPSYDIGTAVTTGQADILRSGNTGSNSGGPHLHITMSSSEGAWEGVGGIFDPHHFIATGQFIDRNW